MRKPTDYVLAVRTAGSPPAPEGVKTVELVPGEGDAVASAVAALENSGLTAADMRARVLYMAPDGPLGLVMYAALCGFAGRRVDAYAEGVVLEFSRLAPDGAAFPDAGRPSEFLMWAQVGGPKAEGIPTVWIDPNAPDLVTPEAASVIRYAARLRMVPPDSTRDALALFVLVAALRRRADDRFPYLSTGTEPVPSAKDDPRQGIDLEKIRQEAVAYRQRQRAARNRPEIVPPVPLSPRNRRIAEANAADVRTVLEQLGSSADEEGVWYCPRPQRHRNGDQKPSLRVYGSNRVRCQGCDAEKIGPVRLVIDVLGVTPDEAASFILESDRVVNTRVS